MASKGDGIGKRVKDLRTDLGLNQAEFARLIGVAQGTLNAYEQETSDPGYGAIKGIVENVKNLNLNWLFTGLSPKYLDKETKASLDASQEKMRMIEILKRQIDGLVSVNEAQKEEIQELSRQLDAERKKNK